MSTGSPATLELWRRRSGEATGLSRLDVARLEELRELDGGAGEASFVARAIGNLLASAPRDLEAMDRAVADGDPDRFCAVTHRLAGAALNLGATHGGEAARALEHAVLSGTTALAESAEQLPSVRQALSQDLDALSEYRDRLVAMAVS